MKKQAVLILLLMLPILSDRSSGQGAWVASGDLNVARITPRAALLDDGRVLLVGGRFNETSCEVWDSESGTWAFTGSLTTGREGAFGLVGLDAGRVLVIGGYGGTQGALASCEIYNPKKGTWQPTRPMNHPRQNPIAVPLPDGRVLVAGGWNAEEGVLSSSEIYDPATESWTGTAAMQVNRTGHRAVLLPEGKVLVTGGISGPFSRALAMCEIYDPESRTWTLVASMNQFRHSHHMILLQNGNVLVVGGYASSTATRMTDICEEYDAAKDAWTRVMDIDMDVASAIPLMEDHVLATGWRIFRGAPLTFNEVRLYDSGRGSWEPGPEMPLGRYDAYAFTALPKGGVLLAGGRRDLGAGEDNLQRTSILYFPSLGLYKGLRN
jgi:hypothetical protein